MPRLTSVRPGSMTSCDLGTGNWRMTVGATPSGGKPALSLVVRYPPASPLMLGPRGDLMEVGEFAQWTVASAIIDLAESGAELAAIAVAALDGGTLELDRVRLTEAMNLFRNKPRIREETFQGCLRDALALLDGYWTFVTWFRSMPRETRQLPVADAQLVLEA